MLSFSFVKVIKHLPHCTTMNISMTILHQSLWLSGVLLGLAFPQVDLLVVQRVQAHLKLFAHAAKLSSREFGRSAFSSYPGLCSALKTLSLPGRVKMVCDRSDVYFLDYRQEQAYFQVLIRLCSSASACRLPWPLCTYPLEWAAGCTTLGPVGFACAGHRRGAL